VRSHTRGFDGQDGESLRTGWLSLKSTMFDPHRRGPMAHMDQPEKIQSTAHWDDPTARMCSLGHRMGCTHRGLSQEMDKASDRQGSGSSKLRPRRPTKDGCSGGAAALEDDADGAVLEGQTALQPQRRQSSVA
jgi:hypothetical protein